MRVIMWMTAGGGRVAGGHRVQLTKTAEALQAAGAHVDVVIADSVPAGAADLVHGFGLTLPQIVAARRRGLPVVLSPIYWRRSYGRNLMKAYSLRRYGRVLARQLASSAAATARLRRPWYEAAREVYEAVDLLLPNSQGEARALRREVRVNTPMRVVPNGVDEARFALPDGPVRRDSVVYVGRLEPHKNQLGLIRALRGSGLPLTIVGPVHPDHAAYADACRVAARGQNVEFVPDTSQSGLPSLLHRARVHAMPSYFETTGLASLEAALCGCSIVSTREGWAREYFGDLCEYCRPTSSRSIRSAVERAWQIEPSPDLRATILDNYTWAHTALATMDAYSTLLASMP